MELSAGFRRQPPQDPDTVGENEALVNRIQAEIRRSGPMTFARFMDLALYDPDGGYYRSAELRPGRHGDFITAPELHPIFGHAVSRLLAEAWERLGRPDRFVVREHGAGGGALAEAVLRGLETDGSDLRRAIRYQPAEIDARRAGTFVERLAGAGFGDVMEPVHERPVTGVVLANEVLDALPVHRVGVREGRLLERYVALAGDAFVDHWAEPSTPALAARLEAEAIVLAEDQVAEVSLVVDRWVGAAAAGLARGLLVLIDYGAPAGELYDVRRRPHGTLRAYVRHHVHDRVYDHIGRQDLTAHVDVTAVETAAHGAGLTTVGITTQAAFLVGSGTEDILRRIQADPATTLAEYVELRAALMRLLDPAAMGRFRVMAFGRDWPAGPPPAAFGATPPQRSAPHYG